MIQSMTGFGSAQSETDSFIITAEVKALNSKFSDIFCRVPKTYSSREIDLRNLIQKELERGKIEFTLNVVPKDEEHAGTSINRALVKAYFKDLKSTATELGFEPDPTELLRISTLMPNAFTTNILDADEIEKEWLMIQEVVTAALNKCKEFRKQEGKNTAAKFKDYIKNIESNLAEVLVLDENRIPQVREKLQKSVQELSLSDNFDANRFEQEIIYYIEKYDISEEKVRLRNHLNYFIKELELDTNGKKLNFISQEIGREINTIGSKANHSEIQKHVVQMKDELEKIKEQTMNIL